MNTGYQVAAVADYRPREVSAEKVKNQMARLRSGWSHR